MSAEEDLLLEIADLDDGDDAPAPGDDALNRYRAGELSPEEEERLDGVLARSDAGRQRMAALVGIDATPSPQVRQHVLGRAPRRPRSLRQGWAALAASLAAVIGLLLFSQLSGVGSLPPDLTYSFSAEGLAEVRSEAGAGPLIEAYAETRVRLRATPGAGAVARLDFGLYRADGGALIRLSDGVELSRNRGHATFSARAADLVEGGPGRYELYVVVASRGELPASGTPVARVAERKADFRFHRQDLVLLNPQARRAPPRIGATE